MSESTIIERNEDMSPMGRLALILQADGDVIVAVRPDPEELHQNSVEFCQPSSGGGRSPETIKALRALAEAMKKDNADCPIFTDSSRQLPPFDAKRYRNEEEMRSEIDRLRTELAETKARDERTTDLERRGLALLNELHGPLDPGTITVRWRKGGAQGVPWDPSMTGLHVMIPSKDCNGGFALNNWFAGLLGWKNITWWVPVADLKPPEIPSTP